MGNQPTSLIDSGTSSHKPQPLPSTANKSLDGFVKRLSLGKKLYSNKSKKKKGNYYAVPPNAGELITNYEYIHKIKVSKILKIGICP